MQITVAGREIEVTIDDKGTFRAKWNGEAYEHLTLAGLKGILERQIKKKAIAIKVVAISDDFGSFKLRSGVVTGRHSGNGNLLVKFDGSQPEQWRRFSGALLKGNVDTKKLRKLYAATVAADEALSAFRDANAFDDSALGEQ